MSTIIERDNGSSMAILVVGLIAITAIAMLTMYALRMYPFSPSTTETRTPMNVDVQLSNPVYPSSTGY